MRNKEIHLEDASPCPFCDNDYIKASVEFNWKGGGIYLWVTPVCNVCGCIIPTQKGTLVSRETQKSVLTSLLNEVTFQWNNRPQKEKRSSIVKSLWSYTKAIVTK